MKKQLIAFPAMLAIGMLAGSATALAQSSKSKASKPSISVGGYMNQGIRFTEDTDDGKNTGGVDQFGDSEIHFKFSAQLDNGLKFVGAWELEGSAKSDNSSDGGAVMDEAWLAIRGSFGEVRLGEDDAAGQLMTTGYIGSWATSVGMNLCFDRDELTGDPAGFNKSGPNFCARADLNHSDVPTVTYISPRLGGFQIGASYARDLNTSKTDSEFDQSGSTNDEEFYAIAANFDRKFDNVRIGIAGTYLQSKSGGGAPQTIPEEADGYLVAGLVDFGPFRFAAGYYSTDDVHSNPPSGGFNTTSATISNEGSAYDIGVRYVMGANSFGIAYFHSETEADINIAGDDESDTLWITHKFILGPGVDWRNTIGYTDWDGEGTSDSKGWGFGTLVQLSF